MPDDFLYIGQTNSPLQLGTGMSLAGATGLKILYTKPDETTGEWTATANGEDLVYDWAIAPDQPGTWTIQGKFTINGKTAYTYKETIEFKTPLG